MQLHDALKKVLESASAQLEDIKSGIEEKLYDPAENDVAGLETAIATVQSALAADGSMSPALVLVSVTDGSRDITHDGNVVVETVDFDNIAAGDEAPVLPEAFRDLVQTTFGEAHYKGIRYEGENTKLELVYCDSDNNKVRETVILIGGLSPVQIVMMARKLKDGDKIIAHQIGLPTPSQQQQGTDYWPSDEIDHVFTTLEAFEDGSVPHLEDLLTTEAPTHDLSIEDVYQRLIQVKEWDISTEWNRLLSLS